MGINVHSGIKALIFDLDGTLSNSLPVHLKTWNMLGDKYGFEFDPQIIHEMTGRPTIEFARHVAQRYKLDETPEQLVRMKQQWFWDLAHLLEPVQEVIAVLKANHKKIPAAVGTGASRKSAEVQLNALGIINDFDTIVSADDVTKHKPHPETFLRCAELMNIEPQHCQVFEDGDLGIEAAKDAGMLVTDVRPYINYGDWAIVAKQ